MPEQPLEPTDISRSDEGRLPVPAPRRQPATTRSPERAVQLAARTALMGPVVAASLAAAATAAAVTAAAAATRLLWPAVLPRRSVEWSGDLPEMFVSYTRLEIWTTRRPR
jgi:hypothetical protein